MDAAVVAWAEKQFGEAELGDARLRLRLAKVAAALARQCARPMTEAFASPAERKGFYRLMASKRVDRAAVLAPHLSRVRARCRAAEHAVIVEDKTLLDFTGRAAEGLGPVGDGRGQGFCLQTSLALEIKHWPEEAAPSVRALGLFDQAAWARAEGARKGKESKAERLSRPRESAHWGRALASWESKPGRLLTYVADREADIFEMFAGRVAADVELIIRAAQPRALEGEPGRTIWDAAAEAPVLGRMGVELRARPGQGARTAELTLRGARVELRAPWRPGVRLPPAELWVVQAEEEDPPEGVKEPLQWILLANRAVESLAQARRAVEIYALRWLVEEYHKALKTGTGIESSQLREGKSLLALLGILGVVAVWLLDAKLLARADGAEAVSEELCPAPMRRILAKWREGPADAPWTNRDFMRALARLGGFLGRKSDGEPGWQVIWRGWMKAAERLAGYQLALDDP